MRWLHSARPAPSVSISLIRFYRTATNCAVSQYKAPNSFRSLSVMLNCVWNHLNDWYSNKTQVKKYTARIAYSFGVIAVFIYLEQADSNRNTSDLYSEGSWFEVPSVTPQFFQIHRSLIIILWHDGWKPELWNEKKHSLLGYNNLKSRPLLSNGSVNTFPQ
jgi:hypothetical protein